MKVTKESIIGEVLDEAPETAKFFIEIGMHCLGCPSARGESIEMVFSYVIFISCPSLALQ